MKIRDLGSSLFWLLVGVLICLESLRMGIGTFQNPGRGFITFGTGIFLGVLSVALFVQSFRKKGRTRLNPLFSGTLWIKVIPILSSMFLYAMFMPSGGYLLSTFILTTFLFWVVERTKIYWALAFSILTTGFSYYIFGKLLNVSFPTGFLGF